jgi:hypothetical protein
VAASVYTTRGRADRVRFLDLSAARRAIYTARLRRTRKSLALHRGRGDLSHQVGRFKSYTARCLIDLLEKKKASTLLEILAYYKLRHKVDQDIQFWQEGSHPEAISDDAMMWQKLEYMHNNPLERGYVDDPLHWRYSSARNYARQPGLVEVVTDW